MLEERLGHLTEAALARLDLRKMRVVRIFALLTYRAKILQCQRSVLSKKLTRPYHHIARNSLPEWLRTRFVSHWCVYDTLANGLMDESFRGLSDSGISLYSGIVRAIGIQDKL